MRKVAPSDECPSCEARRAERLKLDRRIHNQRVALRENWEIVEMRIGFHRRPHHNRYFDYMMKQGREIRELRQALQAKVTAERGEHYLVMRRIRLDDAGDEASLRTARDVVDGREGAP